MNGLEAHWLYHQYLWLLVLALALPVAGKGYMLLPKMFAVHWVIKAKWTYQTIDYPLKDKENASNVLTLVRFSWFTKLGCRDGEWGLGRLFLIGPLKQILLDSETKSFCLVRPLFPHIVAQNCCKPW